MNHNFLFFLLEFDRAHNIVQHFSENHLQKWIIQNHFWAVMKRQQQAFTDVRENGK